MVPIGGLMITTPQVKNTEEEILHIVGSWLAGDEIQYCREKDDWRTCLTESFLFTRWEYRVKPKEQDKIRSDMLRSLIKAMEEK